MLSMTLVVVPSCFGLLIWKSYRDARANGYVPRNGERWVGSESSPGSTHAPRT